MHPNRRTFLKSVAATVAVAPLGRLPNAVAAEKPAQTEAEPKTSSSPQSLAQLESNLQAARRKTGLKIRKIETFTRGSTLSFVRIETDDGSEGWGQISTYEADISATILHRKLARLVLGSDLC